MSTVHTGCRHMPGPLFTGETAVASAETDGACLPCRTAPNLFSLLRFLAFWTSTIWMGTQCTPNACLSLRSINECANMQDMTQPSRTGTGVVKAREALSDDTVDSWFHVKPGQPVCIHQRMTTIETLIHRR